MKKEYKNYPYRESVSFIVINKQKKFLIASATNYEGDWWKFPQGGIEKGETKIQAAKREFEEEFGNNKYKIIGTSKYDSSYDWLDDYIEYRYKTYKEKYKGQHQGFVIMEFLGNNSDIKLQEQEIKKYKWITKKDVIEYSKDPNHKWFCGYHGVILKILDEFKDLI